MDTKTKPTKLSDDHREYALERAREIPNEASLMAEINGDVSAEQARLLGIYAKMQYLRWVITRHRLSAPWW